MRNKILGFLLVASLALNVFFVAGVISPQLAFWPRLMGHPHPAQVSDPVAEAAERLSLDDRQVAALQDLRRQIAERREAGRGDRDGFQAIIVAALEPAEFDRAAVARTMDERRDSFGNSFLDMMQDLHSFLADLPPEKKTAFLNRVRDDRDFLRRLLFPPRPRPGGDGPPPR